MLCFTDIFFPVTFLTVFFAFGLALHCAKADVLHLVLLNLAFLVLLWQAHDELNGTVLSGDQTQLGTAVLTDLGGHLALHQLTGSALLLPYQRSRTNAETCTRG